MRKKLYLTLDPEVHSYLKRNKKNVSSYVEKLVLRDAFKLHNPAAVDVLSSNLSRPTFIISKS